MSTLINRFLDLTGSLGVGVADTNGFLVQGAGGHAGIAPEKVAASLACATPALLASLGGDTLNETILIGEKHCFYARWLSNGRYFAYIMTQDKTSGGKVRYALHELTEKVEGMLSHPGTGLRPTLRERLEQPRQFPGAGLVR